MILLKLRFCLRGVINFLWFCLVFIAFFVVFTDFAYKTMQNQRKFSPPLKQNLDFRKIIVFFFSNVNVLHDRACVRKLSQCSILSSLGKNPFPSEEGCWVLSLHACICAGSRPTLSEISWSAHEPYQLIALDWTPLGLNWKGVPGNTWPALHCSASHSGWH